MAKEIENWWDETSKFYQKSSTIPLRSAHYGPYSPDESAFNLLGRVKGKKILEIGCGGGQCSVAFAKQGAICTALDLSQEQLRYARKLAADNKVAIDFLKGSFQNLGKIKSNSIDIVFSAYALQYSPDLNKVFKQVYRILKKDGIFVFSFDHPFWSIINPATHKIADSYFNTGKHTLVKTWADKSRHKFVYYRVKLSDIFDALRKSRFLVDRIIEPITFKNQTAWVNGPWKQIYPKKQLKLLGPTIIFKAIKGGEFK